MASEACYTVVHQEDASAAPSLNELRTCLEKGTDHTKIDAMRSILTAMLNGEPHDQLLMHVIRFVMPSRNKTLKKLLHVYWEICPKTSPDGKLKQEMILVCNAIRNDLQHPNEYIRGATLRFLCKLREPELLEPLVPTVRQCLEHRHSYVRKNAVFAVHTIFRHFDSLIPDAPELIQTFIAAESDVTCKRNAFVMLTAASTPLAVQYLQQHYDAVSSWDENFQLAVIELIRKDCPDNTSERPRYIHCISDLLQSPSSAVRYEAAATLVHLTTKPTAVKAAASVYLDLACKESDNNVKLIVLGRFEDLRRRFDRALDDLIMDLLRVLSSPDIDVRRKALDIALLMVTSRSVEEVVGLLKKELAHTLDSQGYDRNAQYRQLLVQHVHACAVRFPIVASGVVHALLLVLSDSPSSGTSTPTKSSASSSSSPSSSSNALGDAAAVADVISFIKQVLERTPALRPEITKSLLETFVTIRSSRILKGSLWILGEYCDDQEGILTAWKAIRASIGPLPLLASEEREAAAASGDTDGDGDDEKKAATHTGGAPRVLADGTYATESALTQGGKSTSSASSTKPAIRSLLLNGDHFLGSILASTLTKLVLRFHALGAAPAQLNGLRAEAMLIQTGIIRMGRSSFAAAPIDEDNTERIMTCLRVLDELTSTDESVRQVEGSMEDIFLRDCHRAYVRIIGDGLSSSSDAEDIGLGHDVKVGVEETISFRLLSSGSGSTSNPASASAPEGDSYEKDLVRATGAAQEEVIVNKLNRVVQLTGFSDSVYAEAYVNVHEYDILLDVLIVNQTPDTLRNLTIEFATLGDLRLVEKPGQHNVGPHGILSIKAGIKVSSTETGVIFGNIVYDAAGAASADGQHCVIMNDVHIDIMDYIKPGAFSEAEFRSLWTEFEWENKVQVSSSLTDLRQYLALLMRQTNMACLTPANALRGDCGFLSANLHARSIFGEDALANLSIEQQPGTAGITGHIRIRSKTQGIALSLGDKITLAQKGHKN